MRKSSIIVSAISLVTAALLLSSACVNLSIISLLNLSYFAKYLKISLDLLITSSCVLSSKNISNILFFSIKNS